MDNWEDMHNNQKLEALRQLFENEAGKPINDCISDFNVAQAKKDAAALAPAKKAA